MNHNCRDRLVFDILLQRINFVFFFLYSLVYLQFHSIFYTKVTISILVNIYVRGWNILSRKPAATETWRWQRRISHIQKDIIYLKKCLHFYGNRKQRIQLHETRFFVITMLSFPTDYWNKNSTVYITYFYLVHRYICVAE